MGIILGTVGMIVWTCAHHYFVFVGDTEPEPENQETRTNPAEVHVF